MAGIEHFEAHLITAFLFIMTLGIDIVFVLNKSIGQGKKAHHGKDKSDTKNNSHNRLVLIFNNTK